MAKEDIKKIIKVSEKRLDLRLEEVDKDYIHTQSVAHNLSMKEYLLKCAYKEKPINYKLSIHTKPLKKYIIDCIEKYELAGNKADKKEEKLYNIFQQILQQLDNG